MIKDMNRSMIRTDQLSKYYGKGGEIKAVNELYLEVYEGDRSIIPIEQWLFS